MSNKIIAITFAVMLTLCSSAWAQDPNGDAPPPPPPQDGAQGGGRQGILRELGLSREQMDQVRTITREKRQALDLAMNRLRNANKELDDAIYADGATEELLQKRMNDVQAAELEVLRARATMEFQIRKVLTADQLRRFREVRGRFGNGRGPSGQRPDDRRGPSPKRRDGQPPESRDKPPRD